MSIAADLARPWNSAERVILDALERVARDKGIWQGEAEQLLALASAQMNGASGRFNGALHSVKVWTELEQRGVTVFRDEHKTFHLIDHSASTTWGAALRLARSVPGGIPIPR